MRPRGLLILFTVTAALVVYFFAVERPRERAQQKMWSQKHTLPEIDAGHALGVRVVRRERADTLEFSLRDSHWVMTAPLDDVADQGAVNRLIQSVSGAQVERDLGPATDLARYGLAPPAVVVMISGDGGRDVQLSVGNYTLDRSNVYALLDGRDAVLLVPTGILRYATYAVEDYRNKRATNFDISVVEKFSVFSGRGARTWTRGPDSWFTVGDGDTIDGDTAAVEGILRRLRGLRAYGFPDPPETSKYFRRSRERVEITRRAPHPPIVLRVAMGDSSDAWTQVDGEERVVQVDTSVAAIFRASLLELRDRRILHFDPIRAARVEITTPDTTATLIRAGARWAHPNPSLPAPDEVAAASFMRHLATIRYLDIVDEDPARWTTNLTFRVVVYDSDGTLMDEASGRPAAAPGRTLVTGPRLGLVVEAATGDIDRFTVILRGMNSSEP